MREADRFCWTCGEPRDAAPDRLEVVHAPGAQDGHPGGRRSWPVLAVFTVALVAAVGVSGWWLVKPSDTATTAAAASPSPPRAGAQAASPVATTPAPASPAPTPTPTPTPTASYAVGPVVPSGVQAPRTSPDSADAGGRTTSYAAANLLDQDPATAWRTEGNATGSTLTFSFAGTVRLTEVGLVNGFAKVDPYDGTDRYAQGRRITSVTWTFRTAAGPLQVTQQLQDGDRGLQRLTVTPVEVTSVDLTIDGVTSPGAGGRFDRTAISDVAFANA
ncbi:hypothetical protein CLV37_102396 [Kineococcus rhizosphaerae]|uniref:NAD glycohydrolase translocation F5/8 type C domain-containing protein n=2 Tax=Kineococcus rhizosphaerae TaxID=559628 RepID=A0A2T0R8D0_9ACTN|nr:hypothetical protein CLV37_102396 [Kineococcus rhizosphaerae]